VPLVTGSLAVLECSLERESAVGEQVIVVDQVTASAVGTGSADPLLYHRGALLRPRTEVPAH